MKYLQATVFTFLFFLFIFQNAVYAQTNTLNLSPMAKGAITNLAKDILTQGYNPKITDVKSQLDPADYATVKSIKVLPYNPLYIFKIARNSFQTFFTFDARQKAHLLLLRSNEKTLESLLTLEKGTEERNPILRQIYVNMASSVLNSVGADFDYVSKNIDLLNKNEAFTFAGIYLKHQVLLQQEEDKLGEKDFLKIESIRIKHLPSLAHIVASKNANPKDIGAELAKTVSPQVGLNYKDLATAAILRDLENSATDSDRPVLRAAQNLLLADFQSKLSKLSQKDRLAEITRYASFIHGNPIRQFQAYNQISASFTSNEMNILTSSLKNKAAENFKKHLVNLNNSQIQKQFVQTLFSEFPIDLRLIFYTQIQLENPKVLAVTTPQGISPQNENQLNNLNAIKTILGSQICQNFGQNSNKLAQTRFYTSRVKNPDVLDIKIGQFLVDSIKNCGSRSNTTLKLVTDLQKTINNNFAKEAKTATKSEMQLINEETIEIENEATTPEIIIEEVVAIEEPLQEEVIQKEEQIVEEIIDAAESGETSPLVEELPEPVQEEIAKEVETITTPVPTVIPTLTPTPTSTLSPTSIPAATATPTLTPIPTEEPTLMETVESAAPTATPVSMPAL